MARPGLDGMFADWKERETLAEEMIPMIGGLYRKNIVTYIHGVPLYNQSVVELMKAHRFVRQIEHNEMSEFETHPILKIVCSLNLGPAHLDLGKLATNFLRDNEGLSMEDYVRKNCADLIDNPDTVTHEPMDAVVYGFGRIGRLVTRLLVEKTGGGHNLIQKAVVLRPPKDVIKDLNRRASLLRRDSIHGSFKGTIRVDEENHCLICNGNVIKFIYASHPAEIDYTTYGIKNALVIDSSGVWRDEEGLSQHLKSPGAVKVLLTTSGKGDLKNIVSGVNSDQIGDDKIIAAASCTTNAIVPVLKSLNDRFGIAHGHMETVHAYTDDQNLHDNIHSKERRGRSAPLNMVLTESNATSSVGKLLPELKGKLTGSSIRVPVPNVSMAILNLTLEEDVDREVVNDFLRDVSLNSSLQRQIGYTVSNEVVSSDFVGDRHACMIDAHATIAEGGKQVVLYVWYDNEFGYTCQVIRVAQKMAGIKYPLIPPQPASGK